MLGLLKFLFIHSQIHPGSCTCLFTPAFFSFHLCISRQNLVHFRRFGCLILSLVVTKIPLLLSQCVHDTLCVPCVCTYSVYSPGICKGCNWLLKQSPSQPVWVTAWQCCGPGGWFRTRWTTRSPCCKVNLLRRGDWMQRQDDKIPKGLCIDIVCVDSRYWAFLICCLRIRLQNISSVDEAGWFAICKVKQIAHVEFATTWNWVFWCYVIIVYCVQNSGIYVLLRTARRGCQTTPNNGFPGNDIMEGLTNRCRVFIGQRYQQKVRSL